MCSVKSAHSSQLTAHSSQLTAHQSYYLTQQQQQAREIILNKYLIHREKFSDQSAKNITLVNRTKNFIHRALRFVLRRTGLLYPIKKLLRRDKSRPYQIQFGSNSYPYQSFPALNIPGQRDTDLRIRTYKISDLLAQNMNVLDIGCNIGFFDMVVSEHVNSVLGIDYNEDIIDIANTTAEKLGICNVKFIQGDFNEWQQHNNKIFDVVFSFAVHLWLRVSPKDYVGVLYDLLVKDGLLFFESQDMNAALHNDGTHESDYVSEFMKAARDKGFREIHSGEFFDDYRRKYAVFRKI